ncbi:Rho GTPase [Neurospora sp. IMI 360204]|nr:Rho GTPase [Neurospora sp. IMI 360204]
MASGSPQNVIRRKLVIIGDGACGKTSLLSVFTLGFFPAAHVILIGFSVDTPDSLDNVKHKWVTEANDRCPNVPIILVGLKKDLRGDPVAIEEMRKRSQRFVMEDEGQRIAKEIGARKYLECSSLTGEGVDDVFEAATRAALLTFEKKEGSGCCVIL